MKARKIDIFVATLVLLSTTVKGELDYEKVRSTEFFELLNEPEISERNVCDKVGQMMKEYLNEEINPSNFYEAFIALSTAGLGQRTDNTDFEEVVNSFSIPFIREKEKIASFIDSSEESFDIFENIISSFNILNAHFLEHYEIQLRGRFALGDFDINKDMLEISNLLEGFTAKYDSLFEKYKSNPEFNAKLFDLNESYGRFIETSNSMLAELNKINSNAIFKYVIELKPVLIKFLTSKHNDLQNQENPNEAKYRIYSQILFATYALVLKTSDTERDNYLFYLKKIINMIDENGPLYAIFKRVFQNEFVIETEYNKLTAYVFNINFLAYNGNQLNIHEKNYELYADKSVEFKIRFGKVHRNALNMAENWARMFKSEDFQYFVLDAMYNFVFTIDQLTEDDIYTQFDNYLSYKETLNPEFVNILKFLNGARGMTVISNEIWKTIKMMQIINENALISCIENGTEDFKKNLRAVKNNSNIEGEDAESYKVLMVTDFETKWFGIVTSVGVMNNKKHLEANFVLKTTSFNPLDPKFNNNDNKLNSEVKNTMYHQKAKNDDEEEIAEEFDEESKEEQLTKTSSLEIPVYTESANKIFEHADDKVNKIVKVIGDIGSKAEAQLIKGNLLDRIKNGEKIDEFDQVIYVNVVPGGTPCYEEIIAQLLSTKE